MIGRNAFQPREEAETADSPPVGEMAVADPAQRRRTAPPPPSE